MTLEVCNHCARHVRPDEAACPFCGTSRRSPARLGARVAAAVMTAALVQAACKDDPAPVPAYGIAHHLRLGGCEHRKLRQAMQMRIQRHALQVRQVQQVQ